MTIMRRMARDRQVCAQMASWRGDAKISQKIPQISEQDYALDLELHNNVTFTAAGLPEPADPWSGRCPKLRFFMPPFKQQIAIIASWSTPLHFHTRWRSMLSSIFGRNRQVEYYRCVYTSHIETSKLSWNTADIYSYILKDSTLYSLVTLLKITVKIAKPKAHSTQFVSE